MAGGSCPQTVQMDTPEEVRLVGDFPDASVYKNKLSEVFEGKCFVGRVPCIFRALSQTDVLEASQD